MAAGAGCGRMPKAGILQGRIRSAMRITLMMIDLVMVYENGPFLNFY
jgi:hypothetical protein